MTLRSPAAAMLWELWRVTRAEIAWKLALPTGAGLTALALGAVFAPADNPEAFQDIIDNVAALALILIVIPHLTGWLSMAKLNRGGPGFPLYLSYTRPIRTVVMVGLPMAYLTAMSSAIYLVSAFVLRLASSHAFPLWPVASWMAALTVVFLAGAWSTRSGGMMVLTMMFATLRALGVAVDRLTAVELPGGYDWPPRLWPTLFDWPRTDYAWVALIGLASFAVTVAMVTRQRRGDHLAFIPVAPGAGWNALVSVFRFRCPTSSATRAQLWFALRSGGLPVATIGLTLALVILLVSAVSGPIDAAWNADPAVACPIGECFWARAFPPVWTPLSVFVVLALAGNAFGIRRRQGRADVSAFEASQAYGTAQLAVLKLLVKWACVLAALAAIGASVWMSVPLLGDPVFVQMFGVPLSSQRSAVGVALGALAGYEQLALAVVATGAVGVWVAWWAAIGALRMRYARRINLAIGLLFLYALALVWLAASVRMDPQTASRFHVDVVYDVMRWTAAAALVFATVYVFWRGFAEQALTVRYATGAVALSALFGAAWLTMLRAAGLSLADMPATQVVQTLWPAVLPLTASGLAPWSFSHIRHV